MVNKTNSSLFKSSGRVHGLAVSRELLFGIHFQKAGKVEPYFQEVVSWQDRIEERYCKNPLGPTLGSKEIKTQTELIFSLLSLEKFN